MGVPTKADLEKQIRELHVKLNNLSETAISKSALSAAKAALTFLTENVDDIKAIDMDTQYGTVKFILNR